jgi:hypothetical protein
MLGFASALDASRSIQKTSPRHTHAIYTRVSTDHQTTENQQRELRAISWASTQGIASACSRRSRVIDALSDIEREINGLSVEMRLAARPERSAALVATLEDGMRVERAKLSPHHLSRSIRDRTAQRCKTRFTTWLSSDSSLVSNPFEKWTKRISIFWMMEYCSRTPRAIS